MFRNYLTIAVRSLMKNRLYSAINIVGLAVGLASCILILLYVQHEVSYDKWIPNAERIYRVHTRFDIPGRSPILGVSSAGPALAAFQKDFSEIEAGARALELRVIVKRGADAFQDTAVMVDPAFFSVLDLPMAAGNREAALKDSNSVLLSETLARKYFGNTSPIGQTLTATYRFGTRDMNVVGVFKDMPTNTHLKLDYIARLNEEDFGKDLQMLHEWTSINVWTYLKFKPGVDVNAISKALPAFEVRNIPKMPMGGQDVSIADFVELSLMKLTDLHLHSKGLGQMKPAGDIKSVTTFSVVAVMILLIACINFTNLATARASQRAREVALRKVLGAKRGQLMTQFLGESVLMALIAFTLAIAMVEVSLPVYNAILQKELSLNYFGSGLMPEMAVLIVFVGLASGLYPALYLSRFLPARILKANKSAAAEGSGRLRSGLVVVQFAISIGLLVCTGVVYGQTLYAKTMDLGYNQQGLLVVRTATSTQAKEVLTTLRAEVAKVKGVKAVTISDDVPTDDSENNTAVEIPGKPSPQPIVVWNKMVDYDYFSTFQIPLVAGRYFDESRGGDDFTGTPAEKVARGGNVIINQRALGTLGFASAQEAVGKQLRTTVGESSSDTSTALVTIIGVIGDVHFRSVRDELAPAMFSRNAEGFRNLTVRFEGVAPAAVRDEIGKIWRTLVPDAPYKADFFDALVAAQYEAEEAEANMFAAFAGLAIIVACLGLYGLASFTAERRTKEIGIRKVLGARVRDVVRLMVWDFSKPVVVANLIAWPAAWFLMRDWLNGFQHRIDLNPLLFLGAGLLALLIAWITVAGQAARVARSNPIFALRYE